MYGATEIRAEVVIEGAQRVPVSEATIVTPLPKRRLPEDPLRRRPRSRPPSRGRSSEAGRGEKRGEEIVPSSRAPPRPRIGSADHEGRELRPIRVPGTARQWASLAMVLLAAVVRSDSVCDGGTSPRTGPLAEPHADLESRDGCASCHAGVTPDFDDDHMAMSARCATAGCHVEDLDNPPWGERRLRLLSHRSPRTSFPIAGGAGQCWSCHVGQEEPRDFRTP